jgi:hypothetical protein
MNANIVSRASPIDPRPREQHITVLTARNAPAEADDLHKMLAKKGYHIDYYTIGDSLPENQDIISILDFSEPFFYDISSETFAKFQNLVSGLGSNRLLWLTRSLQVNCQDPRFSLVLGVARTLRSETSAAFTTFELDETNDRAWKAVVAVLENFQTRDWRSVGNEMDPNHEYVLSNGLVQIGRYHAVEVPRQLPTASDPTAPMKLKIGKLGLLQSLMWEQQATMPELGQYELEVEPKCVGLNFRVP